MRTIDSTSPLHMGTQNFTLATWVKFTNPTAAVNEGIAGTWNGQDKYWYVRKNTDGRILFRLAASSNAADIAQGTSNSAITDTAWHHIAVTFDRAGNATFYLDGGTKGTATITAVNGKSLVSLQGVKM